VSVVELVTTLGRETTRNVLLGQMPLSLPTLSSIGFGMTGVIVAIVLSLFVDEPNQYPVSVIADAMRLGVFTMIGAISATNVDVSPFGVIAIATIDAADGGVFAGALGTVR
jgi:uncharacterized membrane protein YeiH